MSIAEKVNIQAFWHMGLAKDVDQTAEHFWKELGIGPWMKLTFSGANCKMNKCGEPISLDVKGAMTQVGPLLIAIDEGLSKPHPYEKIVAQRGGGAHHLAFLVESWEKAAEQMRQKGYEYDFSIGEVGGCPTAGGAYFDSAKTIEDFGTVIELSSPPPEMPAPDEVYPAQGDMNTGGNLGIKGVAHVCIAVNDAEQVAKNYWDVFGIGPWHILTFGPGVKKAFYYGQEGSAAIRGAMTQMGDVIIALEQPLSTPSHLQDFLDKNGQGIHHVCLVVDQLDEAAKQMTELGYREMVSMYGFGPNEDGEAAHFATEENLGIVVELAKPPTGMLPIEKTYPTPSE